MAFEKIRNTIILGEAGNTWYVELWKDGYTGNSTEANLYGEGFEVKWSGQGDTREKRFLESECVVKINVQNDLDEALLYNIFNSGDRKYFVRIYKNGETSSDVWWWGWVNPSFSVVQNMPYPYNGTIKATDSIGTFSKQVESDMTPAELNGSSNITNHIKDFGDASKLYNYQPNSGVTNVSPAPDSISWFSTSVDWWRSGDPYQSADPFWLYRTSKAPFRKKVDQFPKKYKKYDVLEGSLKVFNSIGFMSDGKYRFIQPNIYQNNTSGDLRFYDYALGNVQDTSPTTTNHLVVLDGTINANRGAVMGGSSITYEPPFKNVIANFNSGAPNIEIPIDPNTDFSIYQNIGNMQEDPSNTDGGLIVNLNLWNRENLTKSVVDTVLNGNSYDLANHRVKTLFVWQIKIEDGTNSYYLSRPGTTGDATWVTTEPASNILPVGYQTEYTNSNANDPSPCDVDFLQGIAVPYYRVTSNKLITFNAPLPPITGAVSIKLTATNTYWQWRQTNNNTLDLNLPISQPAFQQTYYFEGSNITDFDSIALNDQQTGINYLANNIDNTAQEAFDFGDILIGNTGINESQNSQNSTNVQYTDSSGNIESAIQGFRKGGTGNFYNITQLLCRDFLSFQIQPLEILQADIFSPDISPIKLLRYSINDDLNDKYYTFMGGTFKAQSDTMSGEWYKVTEDNNFTDQEEDGIPSWKSLSEVNQGSIDSLGLIGVNISTANAIGTATAEIPTNQIIDKFNFSGTSSCKVYDNQKLIIRSLYDSYYMIVTVDGDQAAGVSSINIDDITTTNAFPIGSILSILTNDLTNVITGGGTPGGSNKEVQFNDSGAFGAEAGFEYDKTTDFLSADNIEGRHYGENTGFRTQIVGTAFKYMLAPSDFSVSAHLSTTIYTRNNGGSVQPSSNAGRDNSIFAMVFLPIGYRITGFRVSTSVTRSVSLTKGDISNTTITNIFTGTSNTGNSLTTAETIAVNKYYLLKVEVSATTDAIYGGEISLEKI